MEDHLGKTVKVDSRWKHRNGCEYTVTTLANVTSTRPEYPPTVVYRGDNGLVWTKTLKDFLDKMTPVVQEPAAEQSSEDDSKSPQSNFVVEKGKRWGLSSAFERDMVEFVEHFDDNSYGVLNANSKDDIKLSPYEVLTSRTLTLSLHRYDPYGFVELYLLKVMQTITESWRDYVTLGLNSRVLVIAPTEFDSLKAEESGGFPLTYMAKMDWFSYTEIATFTQAVELSAKIRATLVNRNKEYALVLIVGLADRFANTLLNYLSNDLVEQSNAGTGGTFFLNLVRGYRA